VDQSHERGDNPGMISLCNGLFVAVAGTGAGNRVMTSPDGINWTTRTSAADIQWNSVTYGNGLFVAWRALAWQQCHDLADALSGPVRRARRTTVGTPSPTAMACCRRGEQRCQQSRHDLAGWRCLDQSDERADNAWRGIIYGNGLFVAVASSGASNRVMTSPDGVVWTSQTSAADNNWHSVAYGNGLFVAVAYSGSGNRVMTSPDGISWTTRTSAADNNCMASLRQRPVRGCGVSGSSNRVMTSPDGISWTIARARRTTIGMTSPTATAIRRRGTAVPAIAS